MTDFKCAIFDLDGTVLDSTDVWAQIDEEFFALRGMKIPPDYAKTIAPMGFERAAKYTVETYNLKETPQEVIAQWNEMSLEKFKNDVALKPGVKKYLEYLKNKGIFTAIATASQEDMFIPALKNNNIFHLFDTITTLNEVNRGKGFPDIYLKAAQKSGCEAGECIVFEDLLAGVKGAKDGGFYTVAVYDKNSANDIEKLKITADRLICDFSELMEKDG